MVIKTPPIMVKITNSETYKCHIEKDDFKEEYNPLYVTRKTKLFIEYYKTSHVCDKSTNITQRCDQIFNI